MSNDINNAKSIHLFSFLICLYLKFGSIIFAWIVGIMLLRVTATIVIDVVDWILSSVDLSDKPYKFPKPTKRQLKILKQLEKDELEELVEIDEQVIN